MAELRILQDYILFSMFFLCKWIFATHLCLAFSHRFRNHLYCITERANEQVLFFVRQQCRDLRSVRSSVKIGQRWARWSLCWIEPPCHCRLPLPGIPKQQIHRLISRRIRCLWFIVCSPSIFERNHLLLYNRLFSFVLCFKLTAVFFCGDFIPKLCVI